MFSKRTWKNTLYYSLKLKINELKKYKYELTY